MQYIQRLKLLFLLLLTLFIPLDATEQKDIIKHYCLTRSDYTFSTVFDMSTDQESMESIVKNVFHLNTHYDSYDCLRLYKGTGICHWFDFISELHADIDLYNENGQHEGMIKGYDILSGFAKFDFYSEDRRLLAHGHLDFDQNCVSCLLVHPDNPTAILARLTRNFTLDTTNNWDVVIYYPKRISPQFVKIFAAFICDIGYTR